MQLIRCMPEGNDDPEDVDAQRVRLDRMRYCSKGRLVRRVLKRFPDLADPRAQASLTKQALITRICIWLVENMHCNWHF